MSDLDLINLLLKYTIDEVLNMSWRGKINLTDNQIDFLMTS